MAHDFNKLAAPFPADAVEWRVQSAGKKQDGSLWLRVIPYLKAEAIQGRLDECFGPGGWYSRVERVQDGVLVAIGVRDMVLFDNNLGTPVVYTTERVDGAPIGNAREDNDAADPFRTALSQAFKRAAMQWGIGRYLRSVGAVFADPLPQGQRGRFRSEVTVKDTNGQKQRVWVAFNAPAIHDADNHATRADTAPSRPQHQVATPARSKPDVPDDFATLRDLMLDLLAFGESLGADWSKQYLASKSDPNGVSAARIRSATESETVRLWLHARANAIMDAEYDALNASFAAWKKSVS